MSEAITIQAQVPAPEETTEEITFHADVSVEEDVEEAITLQAQIPVEEEEVAEAITLQATIPQEEEPISDEVTIVADIAPQFIQELKSQETVEGETVNFEVKVTGTPKPEVTWWVVYFWVTFTEIVCF